MNVHIILNAHVDPVWLWPWQAGLDEALATCRSACDRLDHHPDIVFTRGEAWIYDAVERVDPSLFARIVAHVKAGRWEIVGGWWIQPDCNAPSGWALKRQIEVGQRYFQSRFGILPKIGYNVDSFGHAATLPKMLRDHGQEYYVMMRPQEHELALPARLFRWRGYKDGPEVIGFRIASAYCTRELTLHHVEQALTELPEGINDTMCFVGLGDHGGGPTEEQIAWIREHENAIPGARLIFSSPSKFFESILPYSDSLPLVTGELQMHAVGCYSVHREIKTALRRAEHIVYQAETHAAKTINADLLEKAWHHVSFAQFHDTIGGTCLPSAYRQIVDQLGFASSLSDEALQFELRRKIVNLPDVARQRIVAWNASDRPWSGHLEFEPWLEHQVWTDHCRLIDENGSAVPYQRMQSEAQTTEGITRLLFPAELAPSALTTLQIDRSENQAHAPLNFAVLGENGRLSNDTGVTWTTSLLSWTGLSVPAPALHLIDDKTDTWSHGVDRYAEDVTDTARWQEAEVVDKGPLMASAIQHGSIGESRLTAEWRVYAGSNAIELRLQVHWLEKSKVLKLVVPANMGPRRTDGILGGNLERSNVGKEAPLRDWTLLEVQGTTLGIAAPEVYALDATSDRVRFTLLRSPWLAWHDPHPGNSPRAVVADQGVHEFRFHFIAGTAASDLDTLAVGLQRPPLMADVTRGMPSGVAR